MTKKELFAMFQFLIGKVQQSLLEQVGPDSFLFQFLIGKVQPMQ